MTNGIRGIYVSPVVIHRSHVSASCHYSCRWYVSLVIRTSIIPVISISHLVFQIIHDPPENSHRILISGGAHVWLKNGPLKNQGEHLCPKNCFSKQSGPPGHSFRAKMGPCWAAPCTTPVSHFSFMSLIIFNPHLDLLSQPFSTLYPTVQPNLQRALSPAPWSRRSPGARNILPTRRSLAPLQKMHYDFVPCVCKCERNLCLYHTYNFTSWATNQYYSGVANESLLTLQCWCFTFRWWLMSASVTKAGSERSSCERRAVR